MMEFRLPESVREHLLQYLSARPYREVAEGIAALMALQEILSENPSAVSISADAATIDSA